MRKMKHLILTVLLLAMMSAISLNVCAASGTGDDGISWTFSGGALTLSGKGAMEDHLPAGGNAWGSWVSKNVSSATRWSVSESDIKSVVVSKSITAVGNAAFASCRSLTTAKMADSVKKIGRWAFVQCESLNTVYIPSSVTSIGPMAFYLCSNLKDVYYAGTKSQWNKITIESNNTELTNATIHYNTDGIDTPVTLKSQSIKVSSSNISKTVGNAAFSLKASAKTSLTYSSSNTSVASVNKNGKVTIKGAGTATITIKAAKNKTYKAATKKVTITIKPKAASLTSAKRNSAQKATLKWKKVTKISGYEIQYSTSSKFTSVKSVNVGASKTKTTLTDLESGKKYYARIRTYKERDGKTYYSKWSAKKTISKK